MTLVNQPTAAPSRKWWAGLIAGVIVNAAYGAADYLWPGHPFEPYKGEAIGWAVLAVTLVAQYFSRNRASEPAKTTDSLQGTDLGGDSGGVSTPVRTDEEEAGKDGVREPTSEGQGTKA